MKLVGKQELQGFILKHADVESSLRPWITEVEEAKWASPNELKSRYPKASILPGRNVIFDFCWNKYRLWVVVNYKNQVALIKKIGTHKEYDKWVIK